MLTRCREPRRVTTLPAGVPAMPELEFLVDHVVKYIVIAMLLILTLLASISIMWILGRDDGPTSEQDHLG
jgi:hypothetical protein